MARCQNVRPPIKDQLGAAGESIEAAVVGRTEAAGAVPAGGRLKAVAGEQHPAGVDGGHEAAVPPRLSGERGDTEVVLVPSPVATFRPLARSSRQPSRKERQG